MSNPNQNPDQIINKIENNSAKEKGSNMMMMNPENPEIMTVTDYDSDGIPVADNGHDQDDIDDVMAVMGGGESKSQSKKKKEIPTHTHGCYGGCCGHQVTTRKLKPFKFAGHPGRAMLRQICLLKYQYRAIYNALGNQCEYSKFTERIAFMVQMFCDIYHHSDMEIEEYINHRRTKRIYTTADRSYYVLQYELCPELWELGSMKFEDLEPAQRAAISPFEQEVGNILTMKDGTEPISRERDWVAYVKPTKKPKKKPHTPTAVLIAQLVGEAVEDMMNPTPLSPEPPVAEVEAVAEAKEDMPIAEVARRTVPRTTLKNNRNTRLVLRHILPTGFEDESVWRSVKVTPTKIQLIGVDKNNKMEFDYDKEVFDRHYILKPKKLKIKKIKKKAKNNLMVI
mgnify:CR=1 FL=1